MTRVPVAPGWGSLSPLRDNSERFESDTDARYSGEVSVRECPACGATLGVRARHPVAFAAPSAPIGFGSR